MILQYLHTYLRDAQMSKWVHTRIFGYHAMWPPLWQVGGREKSKLLDDLVAMKKAYEKFGSVGDNLPDDLAAGPKKRQNITMQLYC